MSRGAAGVLGRNEWRQSYWEIGEFYILRRADLRPGEIEVRVSIEYYLDRWLSDPLITSRLLDVYRHLLGNWGDLAPTGDEHDHRERLRRELLDAFQRGLLALVSRVWSVGGAGGLSEDARGAQARKWANAGAYWEFDEFYILRRTDLRPGELEARASIESYLDRWLSDPRKAALLPQVCREGGNLAVIEGQDYQRRLRSEILNLFHSRILVLVRRARKIGGVEGLDEAAQEALAQKWANVGRPKQPDASPAQKTQKTWIEVRLVDDEDRPVVGARYRLTITDASTREGTLDENGSVRVPGIDPGMCQVSFPDYDAGEWNPA